MVPAVEGVQRVLAPAVWPAVMRDPHRPTRGSSPPGWRSCPTLRAGSARPVWRRRESGRGVWRVGARPESRAWAVGPEAVGGGFGRQVEDHPPAGFEKLPHRRGHYNTGGSRRNPAEEEER